MRTSHLSALACPRCHGDLVFVGEVGDVVDEGTIRCASCEARYPVRMGVARFVDAAHYADSFGFQWNVYARTQYDATSGGDVSRKRFVEETRWPSDLTGETILEVGSGSGRFTPHAAATNALVISADASVAVEANYKSNGALPNVVIVQADLHALPVRPSSVDRVFCFGVLQHTPDPAASFEALLRYVRPGGSIAVDVYRKARLLTRLAFGPSMLLGGILNRGWLLAQKRGATTAQFRTLVDGYVRALWPLSRALVRIPVVGRYLNVYTLVPNYYGIYPLDDDTLREWAALDLFDSLSPTHTHRQSIDTVRRWLDDAGLEGVDVHKGYNGIEARGRKRAS